MYSDFRSSQTKSKVQPFPQVSSSSRIFLPMELFLLARKSPFRALMFNVQRHTYDPPLQSSGKLPQKLAQRWRGQGSRGNESDFSKWCCNILRRYLLDFATGNGSRIPSLKAQLLTSFGTRENQLLHWNQLSVKWRMVIEFVFGVWTVCALFPPAEPRLPKAPCDRSQAAPGLPPKDLARIELVQ